MHQTSLFILWRVYNLINDFCDFDRVFVLILTLAHLLRDYITTIIYFIMLVVEKIFVHS